MQEGPQQPAAAAAAASGGNTSDQQSEITNRMMMATVVMNYMCDQYPKDQDKDEDDPDNLYNEDLEYRVGTFRGAASDCLKSKDFREEIVRRYEEGGRGSAKTFNDIGRDATNTKPGVRQVNQVEGCLQKVVENKTKEKLFVPVELIGETDECYLARDELVGYKHATTTTTKWIVFDKHNRQLWVYPIDTIQPVATQEASGGGAAAAEGSARSTGAAAGPLGPIPGVSRSTGNPHGPGRTNMAAAVAAAAATAAAAAATSAAQAAVAAVDAAAADNDGSRVQRNSNGNGATTKRGHDEIDDPTDTNYAQDDRPPKKRGGGSSGGGSAGGTPAMRNAEHPVEVDDADGKDGEDGEDGEDSIFDSATARANVHTQFLD